MKKKQRRRPRQRRIVLDLPIVSAAVAAVFIVNGLLFIGGWIAGQHAIEPMRLFAHDARVRLAELVAPEPLLMAAVAPAAPAPRAVQVARVVPEPMKEQSITLVFPPLPPLELPRASQRPLPRPTTRQLAPDYYVELIRDAALRYDVPAALVEAVVRVESDFDARAVSPKGARGLMQLMPATAKRFGVGDPDHLFYPAPNLSAGTAYLAWLLKRYRGDLDLALAAYNAGEGAVESYGGIPPYRETREYVRRVRKLLTKTTV